MRLPTIEQRDFASTVDALLTRQEPLAPLRHGPGARQLDSALWSSLEGLGVLDPVAEGDIATTCLVAEALGRHATPLPFAATAVAAVAFHRLGVALPAGIVSHGLLSADGIVDPPLLALGGETVTGVLPMVPDGDVATQVLALATGPAGIVAVVVEVRHATVIALTSLDATQPFAVLDLADVPVRVLEADPAAIGSAVDWARDVGIAVTCADTLGAMAWMLDTTVEYTKQRVQFGQPIASRQAVKHLCADMLARVESSRAYLFELGAALDGDTGDRELVAAAAKAWIGDAADHVAGAAMQLHGGIGFTWEHDLHHFFKRATVGSIVFGSAEFHRARIAAILCGGLH